MHTQNTHQQFSNSAIQKKWVGKILKLVLVLVLMANFKIYAQIAPDLGHANSFAILTGSSIISGDSVLCYGKLGATSAIAGTIKCTDSILSGNSGSVTTALSNLITAITFCQNQTGTTISGNLDSQNLIAGVYKINGTAILTDTLVLNGSDSSVFIFNISDSLKISSTGKIKFNCKPNNVYWVVTGKTVISSDFFNGTLLTNNSVQLNIRHNNPYPVLSMQLVAINSNTTSVIDQLLISHLNMPFYYNTTNAVCVPNSNNCELVPNGDFEKYAVAPYFYSNITDGCFFSQPTNGTSDYFNSAASVGSLVDVPSNFVGSQGNQIGGGNGGYGGLYVFDSGNPYREFIQSPLKSTLTNGQKYYVEFYCSLAERSEFSIDRMGIAFTTGLTNQATNQYVIPGLLPSIVSPAGINLNNQTDWMLVSGCYTANGTEDHLILGNFYDDANPLLTVSKVSPLPPSSFPLAYYYVDGVKVIKADANAGSDITINCNTSTPIHANSCLTQLDGTTIQWTPASDFVDATVLNPQTIVLNNASCFPIIKTYTLTVATSSGCTATDQVTITILPCGAPTMSSTPACMGTYTGTATAVASGGASPYSYLWSNGQTNSSATNLSTGIYTITVTSAGGCTQTGTVLVGTGTQPATPIISVDTYSNCNNIVSCIIDNFAVYAGCNITWSVVGGTVAPFFGGQFATVTSTSAGLLTITVTVNCSGCIAQTDVIIQPCCYDGSSPFNLINTTSSSAFPTNTITTAAPLFINGTFTVNSFLNMINCSDIRMAPGAKILVKSGNVLTISSSNIAAGCNQMWQGIQLEQGAGLRMVGCMVSDANTAITSEPGNYLVVSTTDFFYNYIGLKLNGTNASGSYLDKLLFSCESASGGQGNLLPLFIGQVPPLNTLPPASQFSLAGIYCVDNQNLLISNSKFSFIPSGIVSLNSNLNSTKNKFYDIGYTNTNAVYAGFVGYQKGIYCEGGQGNNNCTVIGTAVYPFNQSHTVSDFLNCYWGIHATKTANEIHNNGMHGDLGIILRYCDPFPTHLYENFTSEANTGIECYLNNSSTFEVNHNRCYMKPSLTGVSALYGIYIFENNTTAFYNIHHNYIDCFDGQQGMRVAGTNRTILDHNEVAMNLKPNSIGCFLRNSKDLTLSYNKIRGGVQTIGIGNKTIGVKTVNCTSFIYECNQTLNNLTAFDFQMNCKSINGFKANKMTNYSDGLKISNAGILGTQDDQGNLWCGPTLNYDATCDNSITQANALFRGAIGLLGSCNYNPPTTLFFTYSQSLITPFACALPYPAINADSVLDVTDYRIANDSVMTTDSTNAIDWLLKKELYAKLTNDSSLIVSSTIMQQFADSIAQTSLKEFNDVVQDMAIIKMDAASNDSLIKVAEAITGNYLNAIATTTILLNAGTLYSTDSVAAINYLDSLKLLMQTQAILKDSLYLQAKNIELIASVAIETKNDNIQVQQIYEENEKTVNKIYLETVAKGIYEFTPQQATNLFSIANQCPTYGGTAVFSAEGLYHAYDPNYIFDYDDLCKQAVSQRVLTPNTTGSGNAIRVYPNPAQSYIKLGYTLPKDALASMCVFDLYGKLVKRLAVVGKGYYAELSMPINDLASGIYNYQFLSTGAFENANGKLVILK